MYPYTQSCGGYCEERQYNKYKLFIEQIDLVYYDYVEEAWIGQITSETDLPEPSSKFGDVKFSLSRLWEFWFDKSEDIEDIFKKLERTVEDITSTN